MLQGAAFLFVFCREVWRNVYRRVRLKGGKRALAIVEQKGAHALKGASAREVCH
jgi:hypothetical protein